MIYGTQITIVNGVYKPTNITGGPHIVWHMEVPEMGVPQIIQLLDLEFPF